MKLEGIIFKANLTLKSIVVEKPEQGRAFSRELEDVFVEVCHKLEIPIPLWLSKNTREFASFHQTVFFSDQFTQSVQFDRFQIRMQ